MNIQTNMIKQLVIFGSSQIQKLGQLTLHSHMIMYSTLTLLLFSWHYHTYTALYCRQAWNCTMQHPINGRKSISWNCYDSNCAQAGFEIFFFSLISIRIKTVLKAVFSTVCRAILHFRSLFSAFYGI